MSNSQSCGTRVRRITGSQLARSIATLEVTGSRDKTEINLSGVQIFSPKLSKTVCVALRESTTAGNINGMSDLSFYSRFKRSLL